MEGLIPFEQAYRDELVWVWQSKWSHKVTPDPAHIYQYGFRDRGSTLWNDDMPVAIPVCGAPPFLRGSHNGWGGWGGSATASASSETCEECWRLALSRPSM